MGISCPSFFSRFSSNAVPSISLVINDAVSVGRAMAASTTPVFFLSMEDARHGKNASLPAQRTSWYRGSSSFRRSGSMLIPSRLNAVWMRPAFFEQALSGTEPGSTMTSGSTPHRCSGISQMASTLLIMLCQYVPISGAPGKMPDIPTTAMGGFFFIGDVYLTMAFMARWKGIDLLVADIQEIITKMRGHIVPPCI